MKKLVYSIILVLLVTQIHGQEKQNPNKINKEANSFYSKKEYNLAKDRYLKVIEYSDFRTQKQSAAYNAACCLALTKKVDSAFVLLQTAIKYGYNNKSHIKIDADLEILRSNPKWKKLINSIPSSKLLNSNPELAKIITKDVSHFWEAYDLSEKDSDNTQKNYKKHYFDKASDGMQDYMGLKVSSIKSFIKHINSHPKLYKTIRSNTLRVDTYKKEIQQSFKNFKKIYSEAKFPDVYFVIGAFTSGGTVSSSGLLIGTNQMSGGENIDTSELSRGAKLLLSDSKYLPNVVAHELIHFQQNEMKRDTITLGYAIKEGMADFIGELISGDTANRKVFDWAKGKEKHIWSEFKKDMYYNRYNNWIANSRTASKDSFPDLGYWIGYQICKSYYESVKNKKQAIYDMLHIKSYKKFLADSKWEMKLNKM